MYAVNPFVWEYHKVKNTESLCDKYYDISTIYVIHIAFVSAEKDGHMNNLVYHTYFRNM